MGMFAVCCSFMTSSQLTADMGAFYKQQLFRQAFVFLFGLDIVGNPLGLAKDIDKGVEAVMVSKTKRLTVDRWAFL